MTKHATLTAYLAAQAPPAELASVIAAIAASCAEISRVVALGPITDSLGAAGQTNVQQEEQKQLDLITNDMLSAKLAACPAVCGLASEEVEAVEVIEGRQGGYLVLFDPLDGSSNVDVNVSVGTIFSILPAPDGRAATEADFLLPGRRQVAAGYAVYGPQSMLVLTLSAGVVGFTLGADGEWVQTHAELSIPRQTREFAINMSNRRHWADPMRAYIDECLAGREGVRGKDFNMRWIASMVADVHRVLIRGGVFMYPWDRREPDRAGKLRLMYEANPMSLLVERAGGKSTNGVTPILDLQPTRLHERVAVVLGSAEEVERVAELSAG